MTSLGLISSSINHVTLGKLLERLVPQFPHLKMGIKDNEPNNYNTEPSMLATRSPPSVLSGECLFSCLSFDVASSRKPPLEFQI